MTQRHGHKNLKKRVKKTRRMTSRQAFALHAAVLMSISLFVVMLNVLIFNESIWSVFVVLAAGLMAWLHHMIVSDLEKRAGHKLLAPPESTEPSLSEETGSDPLLNATEPNTGIDPSIEQQPLSSTEGGPEGGPEGGREDGRTGEEPMFEDPSQEPAPESQAR